MPLNQSSWTLFLSENFISKNGYEKVSLNVICKNAGITTGALYKKFSTKEDLFNSLVEKPANRLKEFLDKEHRASFRYDNRRRNQ